MLDARQSDGKPRKLGSAAHMAVHVATHGVHVRKTCVATRPQMPFFIDSVERAVLTILLHTADISTVALSAKMSWVSDLQARESNYRCRPCPLDHGGSGIERTEEADAVLALTIQDTMAWNIARIDVPKYNLSRAPGGPT